jgi:hypothetical protein
MCFWFHLVCNTHHGNQHTYKQFDNLVLILYNFNDRRQCVPLQRLPLEAALQWLAHLLLCMRGPQFDSCPENQLLTEVFQDIPQFAYTNARLDQTKNTSSHIYRLSTFTIICHFKFGDTHLSAFFSQYALAHRLTNNKAKLHICQCIVLFNL